jgi:predicted HTH domain antitoxin
MRELVRRIIHQNPNYGRGILTMGKARRLAGISKREFLEELGKRKIERHYTTDELEEDLVFAKEAL